MPSSYPGYAQNYWRCYALPSEPFFIIFAFIVLDALIRDRLLKRIVKANALIVISLVILFTLGKLLLERGELIFYYTSKEFIYELSEITANILLISITYFAWMDTRSRGMFFVLIAFILFFISNIHHIFALFWVRNYAIIVNSGAPCERLL